MFNSLSPLFIPLAVFAGGCIAPILGWAMNYRTSKALQKVAESTPTEQLDWGRVGASAIIAAVAGFLFWGQYSAAISVGLPDIELAFIAGFGADKIVKNVIGI